LILATWALLVGGLWSGLSGSRKLYVATCLPYALLPPLSLIALIMTGRGNMAVPNWIANKVESSQNELLWIVGVAITLKLCAAVWAWRKVARGIALRYFAFWVAATSCLAALVMLVVSSPSTNLERLLTLTAFLLIPLARIGLAPAFLARNRHQL